ncbi:MAG: ATP-binding protein [Myxococcota bacterium]
MSDLPGSPTLSLDEWRADLLRSVVRAIAGLGSVVYVPSVYLAITAGLTQVAVLDTIALAIILVLARFDRLPAIGRAIGACLVLYALGVGLMVTVGSISQIYLFGFSIIATLLLRARWGLATVALNAITMFGIGYLAIASPEMSIPGWRWDMVGWSVITGNFVLVNLSMVLALCAVIAALEAAVGRAVDGQTALENERRDLVAANAALEQEVRERQRTEAELLEQKALLGIAGRTARLGGWSVALTGDNPRVVWSDEACVIHEVPTGTSPTVDAAIQFYAAEHHEGVIAAVERCSRLGTPFDLEAEILTAGGNRRWIRAIGNPRRDVSGTITHIDGSVQDITPQRLAEALHLELEDRLRQAQKMETVGRLAGGVAHDFNNLLSVVLGYSALLRAEFPEGDPIRADLEEIHAAGLRARDLTGELLAFSRQQVLQPKVVDLDAVVRGMEKMLRRLIGEDVELAAPSAPGQGTVLVDPGQIGQVIMNLAVNARDAMPLGGMLTIETCRVVLDSEYVAMHPGSAPGAHMMLAVSDTGQGMDAHTQAHLFEPFFTTKEMGKGTGLGLATVFGIVQQSGGTIWVYSEPGKGTTFKIYFPVAVGADEGAMAAVSSNAPLVGGTETILLVEDEDEVRTLAAAVLRRCGYHVLAAPNGADALELCAQYPAPIHLLLTDVVMPRMSGPDLAARLGQVRPDTKVLFMSGYTDDAVVRHGILEARVAFIQKPIMPDPLARRVRDVLDAA